MSGCRQQLNPESYAAPMLQSRSLITVEHAVGLHHGSTKVQRRHGPGQRYGRHQAALVHAGNFPELRCPMIRQFWTLLRIGNAAGQSPDRGRVRNVGVALAALAVAAGMGVSTVVHSEYAARDDLGTTPEWMFQALVAGTMLIPGLVLLLVAARAGSRARDHRTALVATMGGRRIHRAVVLIGEAGWPVLYSAFVGVQVVLAATTFGVMKPLTGSTIVDLETPYLSLLLVGLVSGVLTLAVVVFFGWSPNQVETARPIGRSRCVTWWAVLCPVMVSLAWYGAGRFPRGGAAYLVIYGIFVVGSVLALPATVALSITGLARLWANLGRVRHRANDLVAGRLVVAHPGTVARIVAGVAIGVCLLPQVLAWQAMLDPQVAQQAGQDRAGWSMVFGVVGIVILTVAAGLAGAQRFLRYARALTSLTGSGSTDSVLHSSATWWVLVPLVLAGVAGTAVGALLAAPVLNAAGSSISVTLLAICLGIVIALGFLMTEWVSLIAISEAESGHPGSH